MPRATKMRDRDLKLKIWLITCTGVAAFVLLMIHGMRFEYRSAGKAIGTIALLLPFAVVFNHRGIEAFANLLTGFLCMVAFNLFLTILTYAGTPLAMPLADTWLQATDAAMGVHLPSIVEWTNNHPAIRQCFNVAYISVLPSTLLALIVLGLDPVTNRMREFVMHFILGGLITTLVFFMFPAEGPFASFGYAPRPDQQRFLEHFYALRSGEFRVVSLFNLEGLITFPSFHTTWAALLAYSFRHYRWIFPVMLPLNCAVIAATMTTGWHYATDVAGGLLTAAIAIWLTRCLQPWLAANQAKPMPACAA